MPIDDEVSMVVKIKRLVHFSIPVTDLGLSEQFYRNILGMEKIDGHERMSFLRIGTDHIVLVKTAASALPKQSEGAFRPGVHHAFLVADTAEYRMAKEKLTQSGVTILGEEIRREGVFTGKSLYFADPDGNQLELIDQRPGNEF